MKWYDIAEVLQWYPRSVVLKAVSCDRKGRFTRRDEKIEINLPSFDKYIKVWGLVDEEKK